MRFRIVAVAVFVAAGLCAANAQGTSPQEQRHALMSEIGDNTGKLGKMAKGETEYDAAVVEASAETIAGDIEKFLTLFPEGSETGYDTRATPAIWERWDEFHKDGEALMEGALLVKAAAPQGLDAFRNAFAAMGRACRECHEAFRAPKN